MWLRILFVLLVVLCFLAALMSPDMGFSYVPRSKPAKKALPVPPEYWIETALKIGACEQPSGRKGKWAGIDWHQTHNYSFRGGLGMTNLLWATFKKPWEPKHMNQATPMQQIGAAWRFYNWAEKTYPNAGYTGWGCSKMIGFRGFNKDGSWK